MHEDTETETVFVKPECLATLAGEWSYPQQTDNRRIPSKQAERQPYIKEKSGQKLQRILIRYKSQFPFLYFMEHRRMDNAPSNFKKKEGKQMRLDKYLKVTRLIKRRTVANEACDAGRVTVNGKPAKASVNVKAGDIIEIMFGQKTVKVEVVAIADTTKKEEAGELFRYL